MKYYTARQTAKLLNRDPRTIYRWIYAGKIKAIKKETHATAPNLIPETEIIKKGGE